MMMTYASAEFFVLQTKRLFFAEIARNRPFKSFENEREEDSMASSKGLSPPHSKDLELINFLGSCSFFLVQHHHLHSVG